MSMLLITGATGFLGLPLVELLVSRGLPLRALVRSPEKASALPDVVERVPGDVGDEASLLRAMQGCEGVFHLAGAVGQSAEATWEANRGGTERVLRTAMRAGVRRLVHTSSSAAIIDRSGLISEQAAGGTAMSDPYSRSKAEAERLVLAAVREGLDTRLVNVTAAYGPSPAGPRSYNTVILAAVRGEIEAIVDARLGWVLAEDVALGHLLAYERGQPGHRYVLGALAPYAEVLNRAAELWGSPYRVRALLPGSPVPPDAPFFVTRSAAYGALGPARIDDAQARAIGFQPRGVEEGLRLTVPWLQQVSSS